jgi:lipid-A-disaccharide synthase
MKVSDIIVTASGTATVEAAIMNVPMVVVYRVSLLSYFVAKMLVRVDHIGMVNLIAGERVVPELIQSEATSERIAHECLRIIKDQSLAISIKNKLKTVRDRLGSGGASRKAALLAYGLMGEH